MTVSDQDWVELMPRLRRKGEAERLCLHVADALAEYESVRHATELRTLRIKTLHAVSKTAEAQLARVFICVLFDLHALGWTFRVDKDRVMARGPEGDGSSPDQEKARLRMAHLHARDAQLARPAVRDFVRSMEHRRMGPVGWTSIFALMRDGRGLSAKLRDAAAEVLGKRREAALKQVLDPYIQFVEPGSVCEFTGLRLVDIWRYFRYTWTTPHNSTPGRRMLFLIRDQAAENHPVIGIAALASAVVQHSRRDQWIGWTGEAFVQRLITAPSDDWARWLDRTVTDLIDGVYSKDFLSGERSGVLVRGLMGRTGTGNRLLAEALRQQPQASGTYTMQDRSLNPGRTSSQSPFVTPA